MPRVDMDISMFHRWWPTSSCRATGASERTVGRRAVVWMAPAETVAVECCCFVRHPGLRWEAVAVPQARHGPLCQGGRPHKSPATGSPQKVTRF